MKIALVGDIAFFGRNCIDNSSDVSYRLARVAAYLEKHDVVIANLETPFVDGHLPVGAKSAHISALSCNIDLLQQLNVTCVTLANNHIFDFGANAYVFTKKLLKNNNIQYFGIESRETRIEFENNKIAMSGYCSYNTNPQFMTRDQSPGVNVLDVDDVVSRMTQNHNNGFLNILAIHSGQEHVHMPSMDDMFFARYLAVKMPYIYYGHHPHVIQGTEIIDKAHIFYSLGNFIFDDVYTNKSSAPLIELSEANKTGLIVSLEIENNLVVRRELIPVYMGLSQLKIGASVSNFSMLTFNQLLRLDSEEYNIVRQKMISDYINERKQRRDLRWYIKRLNLNSLRQVINDRKNNWLYNKHYSHKLKHLNPRGIAFEKKAL